MRLIREIYLATLSSRLNDVSDDIANPASHTVDLFIGIFFSLLTKSRLELFFEKQLHIVGCKTCI